MTKTLDSTAVYAYTTAISVLICVPLALAAEGGMLIEGMNVAIAKVGAQRFWFDLFMVGLLYHLYNQVRHPHAADITCCLKEIRLLEGCRQGCPAACYISSGRLALCAQSKIKQKLLSGLQPLHVVCLHAVCLQHSPAYIPSVTRSVQCGQAHCHHLQQRLLLQPGPYHTGTDRHMHCHCWVSGVVHAVLWPVI